MVDVQNFEIPHGLYVSKRERRSSLIFIRYGAAKGGHLNIVQYLLSKQGDPLDVEQIIAGAADGDPTAVQQLLSGAADGGPTAAEQIMAGAAKGGHMSLVLKYLDFGDKHSWDRGLINAARIGDMKLIQLFINKGADEWNRSLETAAISNDTRIIDFFIKKGATDWNKGLQGE